MADFQGILAVGVAAGVAFDAAVTPNNTAAALSVLGPDYRIKTRVTAGAAIVDGVLDSDLFLVNDFR